MVLTELVMTGVSSERAHCDKFHFRKMESLQGFFLHPGVMSRRQPSIHDQKSFPSFLVLKSPQELSGELVLSIRYHETSRKVLVGRWSHPASSQQSR